MVQEPDYKASSALNGPQHSGPPTLSGSFEKQDSREFGGKELRAVRVHRKKAEVEKKMDWGPECHGKSPRNQCL